MANQITWVIEYLNSSTKDVNGFPEVVMTAGWRCNGTDGTYNATVYGTVSFNPPQEGDPNFTPYNQLTQDEVLNWCYESGVNKEATEANIDTQLNLLENPVEVQNPLPWVTPQEQPAA